MKAEHIQLIPWKHTENVVFLTVAHEVSNIFKILMVIKSWQYYCFLMNSVRFQNVFFHIAATTSFPVTPFTVDRSIDFLFWYFAQTFQENGPVRHF